MQTQVSQGNKQLVRMASIAIMCSGAVGIAALLGWGPYSLGIANDSAAPIKLSAASAQAVGLKIPAAPAHAVRNSPSTPTCAERDAMESAQQIEIAHGSRGDVGCGVGSSRTASTPASHPIQETADVTTLLTWHLQARDGIQRVSQATP